MTTIQRNAVPHLNRNASPVALGFMDFHSFDTGAPMLDAFTAAGGNVFDTAWIYNGGYTEQLLGEWHTARNNRADCVIIGKGAHTPECTPEAIAAQLTESLDRLATDSVDMYFMHRDNPAVPVGEFVEAIDAERRAGRITGPAGGSNWTMRRVEAANAYAAAHGLTPFTVLSNNFSLAEMLSPIWDGCVSSSTPTWRTWLTDNNILNVAWSSQSRGFFTDRAGRTKLEDEELVRVWYSDANFERRDRAQQLADEMGVDPIHIALAYVVAQPFQQIPIIGPRTIDELQHSLRAFSFTLTAQQVAWLETGT